MPKIGYYVLGVIILIAISVYNSRGAKNRRMQRRIKKEQKKTDRRISKMASAYVHSPFTVVVLDRMKSFARERTIIDICISASEVTVIVADGIQNYTLRTAENRIVYRDLGYSYLVNEEVYAFAGAIQQKLGSDYSVKFDVEWYRATVSYNHMERLEPRLMATR